MLGTPREPSGPEVRAQVRCEGPEVGEVGSWMLYTPTLSQDSGEPWSVLMEGATDQDCFIKIIVAELRG